MHVALQKQGRFKMTPRWPHKRSDGLRKDARLERLLYRRPRGSFGEICRPRTGLNG